jgi:hypothetical protein
VDLCPVGASLEEKSCILFSLEYPEGTAWGKNFEVALISKEKLEKGHWFYWSIQRKKACCSSIHSEFRTKFEAICHAYAKTVPDLFRHPGAWSNGSDV